MSGPEFPFPVPRGYEVLLERKLIAFEDEDAPFSPWCFVKSPWSIQDKWPEGPAKTRLVVFARRQDNDDLACFEVAQGQTSRVVLVHGWTSEGYVIVETCDDFWSWVKSVVIDAVAEVADPDFAG